MQIRSGLVSAYELETLLIKKDNIQTSAQNMVTNLIVTFFRPCPIASSESCVQKKKNNMEISKKFPLAANDCRRLTSGTLVFSNGALCDLTDM